MSGARKLLVIRHVPWEGPHTILDAFRGIPVDVLDVLETARALPAPTDLCGVVLMGGPMSVTDTMRYPRLSDEVAWLRAAMAVELPILGVCLGAQLLATALGARVYPGPAKELGFAPVTVLEPSDPLLAGLGSAATVLHWHGEVFDLPDHATRLACSERTAVQAFRLANAWGMLFHAEADASLLDLWFAEPTMASEAQEVLGTGYEALLRAGLQRMPEGLGRPVFAAFAKECARCR